MTTRNRDANRPKIPEEVKAIVARISEIEEILDRTWGEYRLYNRCQELKAKIPGQYQLIQDYRNHRYKVEYR